ncbi:ExeA family protein [Alicyclobacillus sp. SO9]|uniref:ExeA family protein n=1 Tax=Alicyclobacillus sp. SO9 TaxID=2665646 RepID=UPI0018E8105D|nr:AAA family ATPase [Alicyclobacillus sp. SO9]QQE77833.1 AAA family ATPase [Alicyclobacillus sp. SO9]
MFESFYELQRTPFSRDIPTDELYIPPELKEILGRLKYVAERQWFAVVTGDCGIGKTTTVRRFTEVLSQSAFKTLYLSDSKLTPRHFYKGMLEQLGYEAKFYRGDAKRQLHREIEIMRRVHGLQPVAIIDESHLLDREMLEELRFLLNFRMDSQSPMSLILVGQNELWERLNLQSYTAIRQRIDLQCKLEYYDRAHVGEYIERHMAYAGAEHTIFSEKAVDEIYRYSAGAPRLINKVCTHSLRKRQTTDTLQHHATSASIEKPHRLASGAVV